MPCQKDRPCCGEEGDQSGPVLKIDGVAVSSLVSVYSGLRATAIASAIFVRYVADRVLFWSSVRLLVFLIARLRGVASGAFAVLFLVVHSGFVVTLLGHL